jgi:hypothetical protein
MYLIITETCIPINASILTCWTICCEHVGLLRERPATYQQQDRIRGIKMYLYSYYNAIMIIILFTNLGKILSMQNSVRISGFNNNFTFSPFTNPTIYLMATSNLRMCTKTKAPQRDFPSNLDPVFLPLPAIQFSKAFHYFLPLPLHVANIILVMEWMSSFLYL